MGRWGRKEGKQDTGGETKTLLGPRKNRDVGKMQLGWAFDFCEYLREKKEAVDLCLDSPCKTSLCLRAWLHSHICSLHVTFHKSLNIWARQTFSGTCSALHCGPPASPFPLCLSIAISLLVFVPAAPLTPAPLPRRNLPKMPPPSDSLCQSPFLQHPEKFPAWGALHR